MTGRSASSCTPQIICEATNTSSRRRCRLPFMHDYRQEPIVLDGGNVVASRNKVILTDKVYKENPSIERPRLRQRLEEVFQAECIFIPKQAGDDIGHSDGVVRFVSRTVSSSTTTPRSIRATGRGCGACSRRRGWRSRRCRCSRRRELGKHGVPSAVGIYINFLAGGRCRWSSRHMIGQKISLPWRRCEPSCPSARMVQLPCRSLAEEGGVLNCISWTIKARAVNQIMRVCIHRGTKEIGGTCVEIESQGKRLVLDVGLPLDATDPDEIPLHPIKGFDAPRSLFARRRDLAPASGSLRPGPSAPEGDAVPDRQSRRSTSSPPPPCSRRLV